MKNYKEILAKKIKNGESVALYCYGIQASYMLCSLEKFHSVLPAVIIDNDERKRGTAEFGVPVMPFSEAREKYDALQYFICSDDYKYTIIGDLLENGVNPESIINYVPVEKRKTCLYFYNRLLLTRGLETGTNFICHCNKDSFKPQIVYTAIPRADNGYEDTGKLLDDAFAAFESGSIEACNSCVMNREQYIICRDCQKHYKSVAFYQESCADCLSHCVYCNVGGNSKGEQPIRMRPMEDFAKFTNSLLSLDRIDDDFTCAMDMSERNCNEKIALMVRCIEQANLQPLVYKVNSCLLTYSEQLAELMRQGMVYVVWPLDAGTRETYRKIKQIDAFDTVLKNVRRYVAEDVFKGRFIVAKYLIVKGINDNEAEFDAYLRIVRDLGLKFVSLSFDFYVEADDRDISFIQECYRRITEEGLELTYKNNSEPVTRALSMNSIINQ